MSSCIYHTQYNPLFQKLNSGPYENLNVCGIACTTTSPPPTTVPPTTVPPTTVPPTTVPPTTVPPTTVPPTTVPPTTVPPTTVPPTTVPPTTVPPTTSPPTPPPPPTTSGPTTTTASPCHDVHCITPLVIDPSSCNCVPPAQEDPDPDPPPPKPKLPCVDVNGNVSLTISGYAFYRDSLSTVTIAGETLTSPCYGGHWCDRAEFIPKLILSDGTEISGGTINLDNGTLGGDRSDQFSFSLSNVTPNVLIAGADIILVCNEASGNCHNGITWVVLTMADAETGQEMILFSSCVVPGSLAGVGFTCGSSCDSLTAGSGSHATDTNEYHYSISLLSFVDTNKFAFIHPYNAANIHDYDPVTVTYNESAIKFCTINQQVRTKQSNYIFICSGDPSVLYDMTGVIASGLDIDITHEGIIDDENQSPNTTRTYNAESFEFCYNACTEPWSLDTCDSDLQFYFNRESDITGL